MAAAITFNPFPLNCVYPKGSSPLNSKMTNEGTINCKYFFLYSQLEAKVTFYVTNLFILADVYDPQYVFLPLKETKVTVLSLQAMVNQERQLDERLKKEL